MATCYVRGMKNSYSVTIRSDEEPRSFASLAAARAYARERVGDPRLYVSHWYATGDSTEACSCYGTLAECRADEDGAHAARIEREVQS